MALLLLLCLLFLPVSDSGNNTQDKPPEKCSLSGTVVDSATGKPLNKVVLELLPMARDASAATTSTDANGHFALIEIDPGTYHLRGNRSGYLAAFYGSRSLSDSGTIVKLEPGDALNDLSFKLTPVCSISGIIRDSDGEPTEANVVLSKAVYSSRGRPRLQRTNSMYANDRGEYQFYNLTPGKYYVSAVIDLKSHDSDDEVDHSRGGAPSESPVTTYYPNSPVPSQAIPIEVPAGGRIAGIDVTVVKLHVVCVSGNVAVPASGRPGLSLQYADAAIGGGIVNYRAQTHANESTGDFQFCQVPPGSYVLDAFADGLSARLPVNVGSSDVKDLRLTPSGGADIQGRVLAEESEKLDVQKVLFAVGKDGNWTTNTHPLEDGTFTIENWLPDHYDVTIWPAQPGYYVKSIRSGDTDVLADGLTIAGPGKIPLEVVLASNGSKVSGSVVGKDGQPVGGATVLLAPSQRSRVDLFKTITTDQRGRYEFTSIAPGDYRLFAWDDVEPNQWFDPDFLKSYEKQAKAALDPKAAATVNLHLATRPDGQ